VSLNNHIFRLLRPNTIAVIGAAREPTKIGHQVLRNILEAGFPRDKVFPVNPKAQEILGLRCYPSVKDVPEEIDLVIVTVPARIVPQVLRDCAEKRVKAVAIITSGFKEVGNVEAELELVKIAKEGGFRILGPNIVGLCDTVKGVNASFCQGLPLPGDVAFITQSGALAIALVGWTKLKSIGLSDLVSIGNKADIDETDLIEFFGTDDSTKVIIAYLEGIDNGRKFIEVARKVSFKKPIIVLKAGKAERTVSAIKSHTGSLAGSDIAYDAAFKQTGVLRARTFLDLFDWAIALSKLPIPEGDNVVIITNGGGAGVVATDFSEECGLKLMDIPPDLAEKFRKCMPPFGSVLNPIDLTGMANEEWYKNAILEALKDPRVSSVIVLYCHTAVTDPRKIGDAVLQAIKEANSNKPVVVSLIGGIECAEECTRLIENGVPCYESPEKAVSALGALYAYKRGIERLRSRTLPKIVVNKDRARKIIARALDEGRTALTPKEAAELAKAYGIPVLEKPLTHNVEEAIKIAGRIGYPVALEIESPQIIHKTEVGGIVLNINSREELEREYQRMLENIKSKVPGAKIEGIIVRKMAEKGREVLIGMSKDPIFGPLIAFGSGGIMVELIRDVSFRVTPLSIEDVNEMIKETKAYKMLKGFRGEPEGDMEVVKDVILRVAKLAEDFKEVKELDINPFFVYEKGKGGLAIDIKVLLEEKS